MNKINGLGGIYLYNENLKRHLNDLNRYNNVRYTKISK